MLTYLIMAIAITAAVCVILNQYWNLKILKNDRENWIKEKASRDKMIIDLSLERQKLERENDDMKKGWFPATYDNCRRRYGASFKFKHTRVPVNDRVNYFMERHINFAGIGLVPYHELLIRIPV